jgi:hypothetical protein
MLLYEARTAATRATMRGIADDPESAFEHVAVEDEHEPFPPELEACRSFVLNGVSYYPRRNLAQYVLGEPITPFTFNEEAAA